MAPDELNGTFDEVNERQRRKVRLIYSLCSGLFALYAFVYFILVFLPISETTLINTQFVLYLIIPVLSAVTCLVAWARAEHQHRKTMMYLAIMMTLIALAEVVWLIFYITHNGAEPPHPGLTDYLSLVGYAFATLLILSMARLRTVFTEARIKHFVDVLIVCLFAATTIWCLNIRVAILEPGGILWQKLFMTIFPILDFGLVFGVSVNVVGFKRSHWRPWETLIAVGLIVLTFADIIMAYLSAGSAYVPSNVMSALADVGWLTAYFIFFLAAVSYIVADDKAIYMVDEVKEVRLVSKWREIVVYSSILGTMSFFVFLGVSNNPKANDIWAIVGISVAIVLLVIVRAILNVTENNKLVSTSLSDPLTGVFNFRYFQTKLDTELSRANRYGEELSLATIDLDNFGQINKVHGHSIGDSILKSFAKVLREGSRLPDSICRTGGDEFAVILPQTKSIDAVKVLIRMQQQLANHEDEKVSKMLDGFSCGISAYPRQAKDKETLLKKADIAMHWAKFHGRDQVLMFEPEYMDAMMEIDQVKQAEQLAYLSTIQILAATVDARDPYTLFHSKNVAKLAVDLATELGLDLKQRKLIETAALLHDVGKIGIPDSILQKKARLTDEEYNQIKDHANLSVKILSAISMWEILPWIAAHHEKWDGTGYPKGLKGDEIPREARILATCDAYDAMTSDRIYRKALPAKTARKEILKFSGTQFDPDMVVVFIAMLKGQEDSESA